MNALAPILMPVLVASVAGQVHDGDVLVNVFSATMTHGRLQHYRPDGTLVAEQSTGATWRWIGAAWAGDGSWLTTHFYPNTGVALFDPTGGPIGSISTPEVTTNGDVDLFSDGSLAVVDQGVVGAGCVEVYSPAGIHLRTIQAAGLEHPFGCRVDARDELWVCEIDTERVWHFDSGGALLGRFSTTFEPRDVDVAADGSLWIVEVNGWIENYDRDGALIFGFDSGVGSPASGIALAPDGTLWSTSETSGVVRHLDTTGAVLGEFSVPDRALFLAVRRESLGVRYCSPAAQNSGGRSAGLLVSGTTAAAASDLTLTAADLPPGEFGHFLVGASQGVYMPSVSQGNICLAGGSVGRFNRAGEIIVGPTGSIPVDLAALPLFPPVAVQPGDTWNFQCWFRDLGSSNFTDAISVTFH